MIENQKDREATKVARRAGLIHGKTWISFAGHIYMGSHGGEDRSALRDKVFADQKLCQLCGAYGWFSDEMDHIHGKRKLERCDCYQNRLPSGEICTNVQRAHKRCHELRHGRILRWIKKSL